MSRPHSDAPIEVRASADGAIGDVIFQTQGKLRVNGITKQLNSMFNPELRTGEFGLYGVENPAEVYRTILAQSAAFVDRAKETV
jgi:hypothetical protein